MIKSIFNYSFSHSFLVVLAVSMGLSACKPQSDFKLDRVEYNAAEQLEVTNLSDHAHGQKWEIIAPDGAISSVSDQKSPSLFIPIMNPDGMYLLRLTSYGSVRGQKSQQSKPFFVKTKRGYLLIQGEDENKDYKAYADNQFIGKGGYSGVLQVKIPVGARNITLKTASATITKTVVIGENQVTITF